MDGADRAMDAVHARARTVATAVLDALGARTVESMFIGGGVARGDLAWLESHELEIYSDLDLYVVVADGTDTVAARDAARRAAAAIAAPAGVRFLRPDDVGVYTREDLSSQPARPGTVGLARDLHVLHGDPALPRRLVEHIGSVIDTVEGLYLIENRILEIDLAGPEPSDGGLRRLRRYVLTKSTIDVAVALLISRGGFVTGAKERRAALEGYHTAGDLPEGWDRELVEAAFASIANLRGDLLRADMGPTVPDRVSAFGLAVWRSIAGGVFPQARGDLPTIVLTRCNIGDYTANFRQFLAMSARLDHSRSRMLWKGLHISRYAPMAALRLSALAARVALCPDLDGAGRRSMEGLFAFLDRLTEACGFTEGTLKERVGALHRAVA
jgi:hypothetical protein